MTKYLLNLVCIVAIAGAAHGATVANLGITPEGHAYIVFDGAGSKQLGGYEIRDTTGVTFKPSANEDGTGEFATGWVSLDTQHVFAGETYGTIPGPPTDLDGWFAEGIIPQGDPNPTSLNDMNVDGFLARPAAGPKGAPVYIGQILDNGGTPFSDADFGATGRLENVTFQAIDNVDDTLNPGTVGLFTPTTPLAAAIHTDLDSASLKAWQETGDIGVVGTHMDITSVGGVVTVLDLQCTGTNLVGSTYTSTYSGHVMIDKTLVAVSYADITETVDGAGPPPNITASRLRLVAVDGTNTISVDLYLTQNPAPAGNDVFGHSGSVDNLSDEMVVSLVRGDLDVNGNADIDDLNGVGVAIFNAETKLLYDLGTAGDHNAPDGVIDGEDMDAIVHGFVETSHLTHDVGTQYGDSNLDGEVGLTDFTILKANFGTLGHAGDGFDLGNYNFDDEVGLTDFTILKANFGFNRSGGPGSAPPAMAPLSVPEPATMTLLALGGLALVRRRRA